MYLPEMKTTYKCAIVILSVWKNNGILPSIPKKWKIVYKDGDNLNCSLDNLDYVDTTNIDYKDKNSAKELYYEYSKSLYELCKVKDYKIEEIEVKETRQRYVADVLVDRKGEEVLLKDVQFFTYLSPDEEKPMVSMDFYVEPIEKTVGSVISQTFKQTISTCKLVYASLGGLFSGKIGFNEMSGPIGIASTVTKVASESLETSFMSAVNSIIYVMMIITVNLGLFNMLPFPALDGGRFVFLIIEAIRGKSVPRKVEGIVNGVGMALLILLMVVIAFNDVFKLLG